LANAHTHENTVFARITLLEDTVFVRISPSCRTARRDRRRLPNIFWYYTLFQIVTTIYYFF